ncbi:MAG: hypothetical protein WBY94_03280 [Polyangiaceae bacterium]
MDELERDALDVAGARLRERVGDCHTVVTHDGAVREYGVPTLWS